MSEIKIKIYQKKQTSDDDILKKNGTIEYLIKVNNYFYKVNISRCLIIPFNEYQEYLYKIIKIEDFQKIDEYKIIFNTKLINKVIENIIRTVKFDNGFSNKPYFDINKRKLKTIRKEDDEKCLKTIYKELIEYADLSLYDEDFLKLKEKVENKFKLLK